MKIFIIDDEKVVNFITRRLFGQITDTLDIEEFTDSIKALESIQEKNPILIFLDLNMPHVNGWSFLDHMKEKNLQHKVVILSSSVSVVDQEKAATYNNVVAFIEKPAKRDDLQKCLEAVGFQMADKV